MRYMFEYRLKKIAKLAKGKILEVGFSLLPNPFLKGDVTGVDIVLPEKKPRNYSRIIKGDIMKKLPFNGETFDTIIMSGVIEHLENPLKALKECNRLLKKGGILLMETPNPYFILVIISDCLMNLKYYFEDTHVNLFPRRIILKLLWHAGFDLHKILGCGFNLNNYTTIPLPQNLSQDLIYVAIKCKSKNRRYEKIINMRKSNYEEFKFSKFQT